jgi:hypothetical protein
MLAHLVEARADASLPLKALSLYGIALNALRFP